MARSTTWVIRERLTGLIICEVSDVRKIVYLNRPKYQSAPILEYLVSLNGHKCPWF